MVILESLSFNWGMSDTCESLGCTCAVGMPNSSLHLVLQRYIMLSINIQKGVMWHSCETRIYTSSAQHGYYIVHFHG